METEGTRPQGRGQGISGFGASAPVVPRVRVPLIAPQHLCIVLH